MAAPPKEKPPRGLKSINQGREARKEGRYSRATPITALVAGGGVIVSLLIYRYVAGNQLETARSDLLGKQRAVEVTLGAQWTPLRDRVEKYVIESAGEAKPDVVAADVKKWDFRTQPGLYLRLRIEDAATPEKIRKASDDSLRDGFTGCLLKHPTDALARGEVDASVFAEQPWNLRQAYSSTRILTPQWVQDVKDAEDLLRLKVFQQQFDHAEKDEIPRAISIVRDAQFLLLVLDEPSAEAVAGADGGVPAPENVQLAPHWARVSVLDLHGGSEVLRLRRYAAATFVFAGERQVTDPETLEAMKRQVNNCALANAVNAELVK